MPVVSCTSKSSWAINPASGMFTFALSLVFQTKLTGLSFPTKSSPAERFSMSFLSLLSDSEVIEVTWQRSVAIDPLPSVTTLLAVALAPTDSFPINVLFDPVVFEYVPTPYPALYPLAVLLAPVVLE